MRFPDLLAKVEILWDAHEALIQDWNDLVDVLEQKGLIKDAVRPKNAGEEGRPPEVASAEDDLG